MNIKFARLTRVLFSQILMVKHLCHSQYLRFNPLITELFNYNIYRLKAVSRYRDTQLQVTENLCDLWNFGPNIFQYLKI